MVSSLCLFVIHLCYAVYAFRLQPGACWLQRASLQCQRGLITQPRLARAVPESILHLSSSWPTKIIVPSKKITLGDERTKEHQQALPQINVIDNFKTRRPYAIWNSTLDNLLEQAVKVFSTQNKTCWEGTAALVGHGMSWTQCKQRWERYGKDKEMYTNDGEEWTDTELETISKLVVAQPNKDIALWTSIGLQLKRNPHRCRDAWERSRDTSQGRYTVAEDAIIRQRISEPDSLKPGFWARLGKELKRPARTVRSHWLELAAVEDKNKNTILWTDKMDAKFLLNDPGISAYKRFLQVAQKLQLLGYPVTELQCAARWHHHLRWKQLGYRIANVTWTSEEVSLLQKLQKEGSTWTAIAHALRTAPRLCQYKWTETHRKSMKEGPFTPEEDAFIRQKVTAQGGKKNLSRTQTKGFWVNLEREMGRYHTAIRTRWIRTLFHKSV